MDTEKSVGTLLREARLAKKLSLAEAEQGTSIRRRYLEAIENDEYDKTPAPEWDPAPAPASQAPSHRDYPPRLKCA